MTRQERVSQLHEHIIRLISNVAPSDGHELEVSVDGIELGAFVDGDLLPGYMMEPGWYPTHIEVNVVMPGNIRDVELEGEVRF